MELYAVKDKACGIVHVFTANNEFAGKRAMAEAIERNPNDLVNKYSEDFDLIKLADINAETGELTEAKHKFICNLTTLKRGEK